MTEKKIKVFKVRPGAKIPARAHVDDAGIDFFFCPEVDKPVVIFPGESYLLQTGIKLEVPVNSMLQVMNKSSVAAKKSLITGACVVDCGYSGEIFVNLHNIGEEPQMINPGQKLAQGVFVSITRPSLIEIIEDAVYGTETSRGVGALGSTGDN
jgi:dUTP pyrophosphatase